MRLLSALQSVLAKVGDFQEQPTDASILVAPETYFPLLKFPTAIKFSGVPGPTFVISDSLSLNRADRLAPLAGQLVLDLGIFAKGIWDLTYFTQFHNDTISQTTVFQIQLTDGVTINPIFIADVVGNLAFTQIFGQTIRFTIDRTDLKLRIVIGPTIAAQVAGHRTSFILSKLV